MDEDKRLVEASWWEWVKLGLVLVDTAMLSSVAQLCLTLHDAMDCSMSGLPVHHQLPEFTQTHVH